MKLESPIALEIDLKDSKIVSYKYSPIYYVLIINLLLSLEFFNFYEC